ncbi:hypothetical protein AALA79_02320 [Lachnospiraceae bacterium 64-25]
MQGRKKKIAFIGIITVLLLGMLGSGITIYIKRRIDSRMVCGLVTDYTYYDRKLTAEDFLQFDYNTTYEEMIECLGEENGRWGYGAAYPYYELCGGKYAICNCLAGSRMRAIAIVDRKKKLYVLLKAEEFED